MPSTQQSVIAEGLDAFFEAAKSSDDIFITFKDGDSEHWFQCTGDLTLNFDWPFGSEPGEDFERTYLTAVSPVSRYSFDPDIFATYDVTLRDSITVAKVIDSIFHRLYELPADYSVTWKIEG